MKLEVGKKYVASVPNESVYIEITGITGNLYNCKSMFKSGNTKDMRGVYESDGTYIGGDRGCDLVAEYVDPAFISSGSTFIPAVNPPIAAGWGMQIHSITYDDISKFYSDTTQESCQHEPVPMIFRSFCKKCNKDL